MGNDETPRSPGINLGHLARERAATTSPESPPMASAAPTAAAGWYADTATGRQRYWDGHHWLDVPPPPDAASSNTSTGAAHTSVAPAPTPPAASPTAPTVTPQDGDDLPDQIKRWWRRASPARRWLTVGALAVAALAVAIGVGVSHMGSHASGDELAQALTDAFDQTGVSGMPNQVLAELWLPPTYPDGYIQCDNGVAIKKGATATCVILDGTDNWGPAVDVTITDSDGDFTFLLPSGGDTGTGHLG